MQDLVAVDVVEAIQKLLHDFLDLAERELHVGVAEQAGEVVFAELKDEIERALVAIVQRSYNIRKHNVERNCKTYYNQCL